MAKSKPRPIKQRASNARGRQPSTRRRAEQQRQRKQRSRRLVYVALAVAAAVIIAVVAAQDDRGDESESSNTSDGPSSAASLLRTEAPWPPQSDGLDKRVEAAGFPPVGDESFHVHALLSVYVEGEQVPVPVNIGIDQASRYHSPLHTHTPDGVIHFEADEPSPFTLQQVFTIWGVDFGPGRLGAYTPDVANQLYVYVNGEPVDDPIAYEIRDGDNVVVAFGEQGSFPAEPSADALANA